MYICQINIIFSTFFQILKVLSMGVLSDVMEHLKDPALVAEVQSYFGVERVTPSKQTTEILKSSLQSNGSDSTVHKRNVKNAAKEAVPEPPSPVPNSEEDSDSEDNFSSDVDAEACGYRITKKFWFYLFTLGTALGDELFYATFIPFWFWNVDGAVGRRMVLVWCINMYVGKF